VVAPRTTLLSLYVVHYNKSWKEQLGIDYNGLLTYFERIEAYHPEFSSNAPISPLRFTNGLIQMTPLPVSLNLAPRIRPLFWRGVQDPSILGKALRVITDAGPLRASDIFSNNVIAVINNTTTVPIVDDYNTDVVTCITTTPQLFVDSVVGVRQSTDVKYLDKRMIRIDSAWQLKETMKSYSPFPLVPWHFFHDIMVRTPETGNSSLKEAVRLR
jgi:hypothetical protein